MTKKMIISIYVIAALCLALSALCAVLMIRTPSREEIRFTVNDTLPDGKGQKARIILLGGQSNASGCSRDDYLNKRVSAEQYAEYDAGYDTVYINYFASGTNASEGFVRCGARQGEAGGFFGPELGLAQTLHAAYPDETLFIIKYAWGGTNLYEQWLSPSSWGPTGELYEQFVAYVNSSIEYLEHKNYEVEIEAMCWMQGESDSFDRKNATDYRRNLENLIGDIRNEFHSYSSADGIAFVDAYIADNPVYWVYCEEVNESKRAVADSSPMNALVDTLSAGLTCAEEPEDAPDMAHYDSLSEITLGNLFGEEALKFFD